jgi:hypothetical protein
VTQLAKPVVQAVAAAPSPLSMMSVIAKAVEAGMSEEQALKAVMRKFPKADPDDVEEHLENHDSYLIPDEFTGEVVFKGNPKNTAKTLELVQQVYFDVSDFLEREDTIAELESFPEYTTLEDFMTEQKSRLEEIETRLEQSILNPSALKTWQANNGQKNGLQCMAKAGSLI